MPSRRYETALEIDADAQDALEALKRLYYGRGRHRDSIRMLELEAARTSDLTLRIAALHSVARLHTDKLGNRPDAILALERALSFAPQDRLLLEELVQLKEAARDYPGLAAILSQLAEALGAVPDRAGLLHRIGQIHDEHLSDPDTAQRWFARRSRWTLLRPRPAGPRQLLRLARALGRADGDAPRGGSRHHGALTTCGESRAGR